MQENTVACTRNYNPCISLPIVDRYFPQSGTPIVELNDSLAVAELFHGPSASFKDYALQLFPHFLRTCQGGAKEHFC